MPGSTINEKADDKSMTGNGKKSTRKQVSKDLVIEKGLHFLREAGAEHICSVCIENGGSCCSGCRHLLDGMGCQRRNTSCTAWLCGFLKFVLYEMELLQDWDAFWNQIPGQSYREDFTPETITIRKDLVIRNFQIISKALASDLQELEKTQIAIGFIISLREKINKHIDRLGYYKNDPLKKAKTKENIRILSTPFYRFHKACAEYRLQHQKQAAQLIHERLTSGTSSVREL
ncbi:hypothetical protein [Paenibacillus lignilyticus]|uniref:DNA mismatch repair protein n=1 Tax=Paenibacillus lignilyticus TaxID=1172615 RepID=A0ABS5CNC6_9BACL|nr:hypothetical protein [Paenibacillus lignilyticus]MBP3967346.1 hypothetical protein [Paenibacillus lignilyticus]